MNCLEKKKYFVNDCHEEISITIDQKQGFGEAPGEKLKGMTFYEFSLEELGLPPAVELLEKANFIKDSVGLQGWRTNGTESTFYKGFSLSYNPEYTGSSVGIYHQTFGDSNLLQNFGRQRGMSITRPKNTYYDSFGFRYHPPLVKEQFGDFLDKFSMPLLRSRMAWNYGLGRGEQKENNWHVDEFPFTIFRINIPLQTSEEHVIDIVGEDEYGNKLEMFDKHLEVGKAYMWNTRIPHRVTFKQICNNPNPRIHMVLGFSPWFNYNKEDDSFESNEFWGLDLDYIIRNKLFLKQ